MMNSTVVTVSSAKEVLSLRLLEWIFGDASSNPEVFDSEEDEIVLEVVCVRCGLDTSKGKFAVKFDGLILQMSLLVISSTGFELVSFSLNCLQYVTSINLTWPGRPCNFPPFLRGEVFYPLSKCSV